jgi:hypothetical protein
MTAQATAGRTLQKLTRIGFACKGVVYLLIGLLALKAAFHQGGERTDRQGAMERIAAQPFGEYALVFLGVGLLAYAGWRLLCGVMDLEHEGDKPTGLAKRIGYLGSGALYASAGVFAFKLLTGNGGGQSEGAANWTARLMNAPGGTILVVIAGLIIAGAGIMQIRKGWKEDFRKHLQTGGMSSEPKQWAVRADKWGYVVRGVVFSTIGLFVVSAAMRHDPSQARGIEGALDALAAQPYGQ